MIDSDRLAADGCPYVGGGVERGEGGSEGDGLADGGGGGGRGKRYPGLGIGVNGYDAARRGWVGAVAGEGGVVGALTGGAKALGEGDLAGGVSVRGGVGVLDAVEVVVDGDGFVGEGSAAFKGGSEGDGFTDGRGGGGCGEGGSGGLGVAPDVDVNDAARR